MPHAVGAGQIEFGAGTEHVLNSVVVGVLQKEVMSLGVDRSGLPTQEPPNIESPTANERRNSDSRKKCVPVWQIAVEFLHVAMPFSINQSIRFARLHKGARRPVRL